MNQCSDSFSKDDLRVAILNITVQTHVLRGCHRFTCQSLGHCLLMIMSSFNGWAFSLVMSTSDTNTPNVKLLI
uniref:Uncharacterized protein n=1 Tax=Octopus bimaculoides TaxID=37653 RepID=A0A0L8FP22_OCTBM